MSTLFQKYFFIVFNKPVLEYSLYLNTITFHSWCFFLRLRHWVDVLKHALVSRTWCSVETGDHVGRCRCLSKLKLYDSIYCFLCRFRLVNQRILDTNGLKCKFDVPCAMQTMSVNNIFSSGSWINLIHTNPTLPWSFKETIKFISSFDIWVTNIYNVFLATVAAPMRHNLR